MKPSQSSVVGRTTWLLSQFRKKIWVRAALFSLAAVVVAILAALIGPYIPYDPGLTLASGSVDHILNILASSMLAVTTFSLSIMVSAYASATSNVTPRSTKLLIADPVAQNTLATFVGSFLFSIVGIIGLAAGLYDDKGRIILFMATLVVIFLITATLLRWIEQLGNFGRVGDTILRVERAAVPAFRNAGRTPRLGAMPWIDIPGTAVAVLSSTSGLVEHIDVSKMDELAKANGARIFIGAMPGALVHPSRALFHFHGSFDDAAIDELRKCISVGDDREYEQDPRFGLIVLSEIASRALSPAVNDPGTAIEVLGSGMRVLLAYADAHDNAEQAQCHHVHAPDLDIEELFTSFFNPIARDGCGIVEVQMRLIAVLEALASRSPELFGNAAGVSAMSAVERSNISMVAEHDKLEIARRAERANFAAQIID
ncbi:DUF2254 domain-containing protein [Sphingorhabdus sp.]|uniref:DUF2254 domain-containing protein n=1 Tax=Sphingorhabdus sp. TaxID=1902408 RepID=UPI003593249E